MKLKYKMFKIVKWIENFYHNCRIKKLWIQIILQIYEFLKNKILSTIKHHQILEHYVIWK